MEQKRRNWLMCFVTLVLVFGLAGSAFAADVYWDGGGSDNLWTTPENWVGDVLPGTGDAAKIYDPCYVAYAQQPLVCDGVEPLVYRVITGHGTTLTVTGGSITAPGDCFGIGYPTDGPAGPSSESFLNISGGEIIAEEGFLVGGWDGTGTVNMSGGTITVASENGSTKWWYQVNIGEAGPGTLNMSDGTINAKYGMLLSRRASGRGTINMTGGTINVGSDTQSGDIQMGTYEGASLYSEFNLDGGLVTADDLLMSASSRLDLAGGTMVLAGDDRVDIQVYIDSGQITGYGFQGAVIMDYSGTNNETTLTGDPDFNAPPIVDAGKYQSISSLEAQLDPCVSDDNKPDPPTLTYTWSGPDGVSFSPSNVVEAPIATFPAVGFYDLQLSVSDSEKDACDVVTICVRPNDNPIAHWDFETGNGTNVVDRSVNNNFGTCAGDLEPNWVDGWIGNGAMEFYGVGDPDISSYVDITSDSTMDPNLPNLDNLRYDVTLSAWFKIDDFESAFNPAIIASSYTGWRLYVESSEESYRKVTFTPGDSVAAWQNRTYSTMPINDSYWHHVVGIHDYANSKSYLYIDGVLDAESDDHVGMMADADDRPVTIGARATSATEVDRSWNGEIDDVRVYSYCISEAKIAELADMGDLIPQVNAGVDRTVFLQDGAVQLTGTATDDGKPNLSLDIRWTKVSGPDTVIFDPCNAAETAVTFPEAPDRTFYVLRLTADDGQTTVFDDVEIEVRNPDCEKAIAEGYRMDGDISGPEGKPDCYVNLYDFAAMASDWLRCNNPQDAGCEFPYPR